MEDKKIINSKGRVLSGKELKEHLKAFSDIDESIKQLEKGKKENGRKKI